MTLLPAAARPPGIRWRAAVGALSMMLSLTACDGFFSDARDHAVTRAGLDIGQTVQAGAAAVIVSGERPMPAALFVDRIGVAAHLNYSDGWYRDLPRILNGLAYLGVHHIRTDTLDSSLPQQAHYRQVAEAGYCFAMLIHAKQDLSSAIAELTRFNHDFPGRLVAVEGPNEVNNWPISYDGRQGDKAAVAFQRDLYRAVRGSRAFSNVAVYNLTSWPILAGSADLVNFHPYAHGGAQPTDSIVSGSAMYRKIMPGRPFVLTETGYHDLVGKGAPEGVDRDTAAILTLNTLLEGARLGARRTYLYELLDAYPDPNMTDKEKHFGLFDVNGAPKPSATAIRNLLRIVRGGDGTKGAPGHRYRRGDIKALGGADVRMLPLQRSDGALMAIVYRTPPIWDSARDRRIPIAPVSVAITSRVSFPRIEIFDPIAGESPIATPPGGRAVTLELGAEPRIVVMTPPPPPPRRATPHGAPKRSAGVAHLAPTRAPLCLPGRRDGGSGLM